MTDGCAGLAFLRPTPPDENGGGKPSPAQSNGFSIRLTPATRRPTRASWEGIQQPHCISTPRGAPSHISPIESSTRANHQKTAHLVLISFRIFDFQLVAKFKSAPSNVNCPADFQIPTQQTFRYRYVLTIPIIIIAHQLELLNNFA